MNRVTSSSLVIASNLSIGVMANLTWGEVPFRGVAVVGAVNISHHHLHLRDLHMRVWPRKYR